MGGGSDAFESIICTCNERKASYLIKQYLFEEMSLMNGNALPSGTDPLN